MREVKARELTVEGFLPYGRYANLVDPCSEKLGSEPVEFFRDMVQQDHCAGMPVSFSTCRVGKREMVIDVTEYHTGTAEGILPLDNDVLIHVAPATPRNGVVPIDRIEVFRVPKGTMVVLRPGIWHHAPFTLSDLPANVLIVLPERTYANDCEVLELKQQDRIRIRI